jgi:hypothetical protein
VLVALSISCLTRGAHAQGPRLRIDYRGDSGCPSVEAFLGAVRERIPDVVFVAAGQLGTLAQVSAARRTDDADAYEGDVTFFSAEGKEADRHVVAPSCEEVQRALALIISVYLRSSSEEPDPDERKTTPPDSVPRRTPDAQAPTNPRQKPWLVSTGVGAGFRNGVSEGLAPEVFITGGLLRDGGGILSPSVRVRATYAWATLTPDGSAERPSFRLFVGAIDGCPVVLPISPRFLHLTPCVRFETGLHTASLETKPSGRGAWVAAGPVVEATGYLARGFGISMGGAAMVPIVRNEFAAQTATEPTLFKTPIAVLDAWVMVGLSF